MTVSIWYHSLLGPKSTCVSAGVPTPDILGEIGNCVADCEGYRLALSPGVSPAATRDSPLVDAVSLTAGTVTGERIFRRSATGGGDAKGFRNADIPTVEFGLGTDTIDTPDKYILVDTLVDNAIIFAHLPAAWHAELSTLTRLSHGVS